MSAIELPARLIEALTKLGLIDSEARIYVAIVQLRHAEVKTLLDTLDLSKPSIYDGLRSLQERGLITLTCPRPVTYLAVEPRIALEMLARVYEEAKIEAQNQFRLLENVRLPDLYPEPVWSIYGSKSFEFKILDMLKNARKTVTCQMSGKYLDYFENTLKKNIALTIILTADNPALSERLEKLKKKCNAHVIVAGGMEGMGMDTGSGSGQPAISPEWQAQLASLFDPDNHLILLVDDVEMMFVPPLKTDSMASSWTTNRGLVLMMKYFLEMRLSAAGNMIK